MLSKKHKLDCDICRINYGERWQVLVNSDYTCYPHLTLCSALMNTCTTSKHAILFLEMLKCCSYFFVNQLVHFALLNLVMETVMKCHIVMAEKLY